MNEQIDVDQALRKGACPYCGAHLVKEATTGEVRCSRSEQSCKFVVRTGTKAA